MKFFQLGLHAVMERQAWIAAGASVLLICFALARNSQKFATASRTVRMRARVAFATLLTGLVVFGALTYFYSSRHATFLHRWDMFHTVTTVRFFDELEYTRLYECTLALDERHAKHFTRVTKLRDLSTLRHVRRGEALRSTDCLERFSPERAAAFVDDLEFWWNGRRSLGRWSKLFRDKGYNGTPFYSAAVSWLVGDGTLDEGHLRNLALMDIALVCLALALVARSFGPVAAAFAALFFFVNFPGRFTHMGGSILRFDYVAYLMVGMCLLQLKRHASSGVFFALAAMTRGFPLLFAVAVGVKAVLDVIEHRRVSARYLRFFAGFGIAAAVCFAASLSFGGLDAWAGFIDNIELHTSRTATFRIGFQHLFIMDGNSYGQKAALMADRRVYFLVVALVLLAPAIWLSRRMSDTAFAALGGLLMFFLLTVATRYYYSVLVLVFLAGYDIAKHRWYLAAWLLSFSLAIAGHLLLLQRVDKELIYNTFYTVALLVFFAALWAALAWHHRAGAVLDVGGREDSS